MYLTVYLELQEIKANAQAVLFSVEMLEKMMSEETSVDFDVDHEAATPSRNDA